MSDEQLKAAHTELTTLVNSLSYDLNRVLSGNKSAHTTLRNKLQSVKKICDTLRKDTLAHGKALPTKSRKARVEALADEGMPDIEEAPEQLTLQRESTSTVPKKSRRKSAKRV
jgi:hypothetical protein